MERSHAFLALSALTAAVLAGGCDPKLVDGVSDNTGGGGNSPPTVAPEAVITGAVVAFQTELLAGALTVAGDFDNGGAAPVRSFLGTSCMTITVVDAQAPIHAFDLNGCTDANGTAYYGQGEFTPPIDATDGFLLVPDTSLEGTIVADNAADTDLHHSVTAGSLTLEFRRNGSTVDGLTVGNFLRHFIRDTPDVAFSYDGVTYTGGIGSMGPYPDNGGAIHVSWDGVGLFDVNFDGGPNASFRVLGQDYVVDLATGAVQFAATP